MLSPYSTSSFIKATGEQTFAFGNNASLQLGTNGSAGGAPSPICWDGSVSQIVSTKEFSILLDHAGCLATAGKHNKKKGFIPFPHPLPPILSLSAGAEYWAAIDENGEVWTANTSNNGMDAPKKKEGLPSTCSMVACGLEHSLIATSDGRLWCWGSTDNGRVGIKSKIQIIGPTQVELSLPPGPLRSISTGSYHSAIVDSAGVVWTTGSQFHNGRAKDCETFLPLKGLSPMRSVVCGPTSCIAIDVFGKVWCWGKLYDSARGAKILYRIPALLESIESPQETVSCGKMYYMFTNKKDQILVMGNNDEGQLGLEKVARFNFFNQVFRLNLKTIEIPTLHPLKSVAQQKPSRAASYDEVQRSRTKPEQKLLQISQHLRKQLRF